VENIIKGAVVTKSVPAAGEMGLINAQALRELRADEVFTFRIAAADDQVDRDFEHFSVDCLKKLARLYVGKTVIADHQWSSGNQVARVYAGTVEEDGGIHRLILNCYMLRSEATQAAIDAIEAGIVREVSVSVAVRSAVCDICGTDKSKFSCKHQRGQEYDGKVCTVELRDPAEAYEVSFVAVPAQREAGVVKFYAGDWKNFFKDEDAARRKKLSAIIALEKVKFVEEVQKP